MPRCAHSSTKCAPFQRALGEQHAVVGDDADQHAGEPREAGHQRRSVARLELVELGAVDQPGDDLAHVVLLAQVDRRDRLQLLGRIERLARGDDVVRRLRRTVEIGDRAARQRQRLRVVARQRVGDAGDAGVQIAAAEVLGA